MMKNLKDVVKILLIQRGMKMKELANELEIRLQKPFSPTNLSARLKRGSLTYNEIVAMCEALEYEIEFKSKTY